MRASLCSFTVLCALFAACSLVPRTARACGAIGEPSWTIVDTWPPTDATDVPTDAALLFQMEPWGEWADYVASPYDAEALVVRVATVDGDAVPGTVDEFARMLVWRPDAPLAPETSYVAEVAWNGFEEPPDDAEGTTQVELRFTTAAEPLPDLRFAVDPEVTFEPYEAVSSLCEDGQRRLEPPSRPPDINEDVVPTCYPWVECVPDGSETTAQAVVQVGPIEGGQTTAPYVVEVFAADERGRFVSDIALTVMLGFETLTFPLLLREQESDYAACVWVSVWDSSGRTLEAELPCAPRSSAFPATEPEQADPAAMSTAGTTPPQPANAADPAANPPAEREPAMTGGSFGDAPTAGVDMAGAAGAGGRLTPEAEQVDAEDTVVATVDDTSASTSGCRAGTGRASGAWWLVLTALLARRSRRPFR